MTQPRKVPYYMMVPSAIPFMGLKWKEYWGSEGCVPIATQKTVSMDRLAPGEVPPPKPPKPTLEQVKAQKAEEERQKLLAQLARQQSKDRPKEKVPDEPVDEECENPPVFDMLDLPDAMEKMKWPVSAKVARRWFNGEKHIYNDKLDSIQPIDDTTVTLDWALKFGSVKKKFNNLLAEAIYSEKAVDIVKEKVRKKIYETFVTHGSTSLSFGTTDYLGDLRQFHIDWHFQRAYISTQDTANGLVATDLSGSLGKFNIYAAIGNVVVSGDRYFKYDGKQGTKTFFLEPKIQITHVYVYLRDNYSFNDEAGSKKSQYLGHWNKSGFVVTGGSFISDLVDGKRIHTDLGNSREYKYTNLYYLISNGLDKPVDARRGMIRKFREEDFYYPIYNKSYREWREKHNRGGDFMIYSKPKYMKLKRPIEFSLETLCRQPEKM